MLDKSIFGYIGSTVSNYLYAETSSLYVATFLPKEQAALYFSAGTIAMIVGLLSAAQTQKMLPELIKSDTKKNNRNYKKEFNYCWRVAINCFIISSRLWEISFKTVIWSRLLCKCLSDTNNVFYSKYIYCKWCYIWCILNSNKPDIHKNKNEIRNNYNNNFRVNNIA